MLPKNEKDSCRKHVASITTHLQYIKTKRRYVSGEKSVYDSSGHNFSFRNATKCNEIKCRCQHFLQTEEWVVLDPKYCESCVISIACPLSLECQDCRILLHELRTENWRKFDQMWRKRKLKRNINNETQIWVYKNGKPIHLQGEISGKYIQYLNTMNSLKMLNLY